MSRHPGRPTAPASFQSNQCRPRNPCVDSSSQQASEKSNECEYSNTLYVNNPNSDNEQASRTHQPALMYLIVCAPSHDSTYNTTILVHSPHCEGKVPVKAGIPSKFLSSGRVLTNRERDVRKRCQKPTFIVEYNAIFMRLDIHVKSYVSDRSTPLNEQTTLPRTVSV
jgi:hypothetical protein